MFRQITGIFLFVAFLAQTFNGGFVMLNYYTNTAAFARNCVNKAKPKIHCNGKCQLMKKLQEEENKEQQLPVRKFENKIDVLAFNSFFCGSNATLIIIDKAIPKELDSITHDISFDFFHPPQV